MPTCQLCNSTFSNWVRIDGVKRNLKNRKYCLSCSPFRKHNTRKIDIRYKHLQQKIKHKCKCPQCSKQHTVVAFTEPKPRLCPSCATTLHRKKVKQKALEYMGGKCALCGYGGCVEALDFHHLKDKDFTISKYITSWKKTKQELDKCVLLCANCHRSKHRKIKKIHDGMNKTAVHNFRINQKEKALEYLGRRCVYCGYDKFDEALEFHHVDPRAKAFKISDGNTRSWSRVRAELDKCIIVCANCHREIHAAHLMNKRAGRLNY